MNQGMLMESMNLAAAWGCLSCSFTATTGLQSQHIRHLSQAVTLKREPADLVFQVRVLTVQMWRLSGIRQKK
jgi:hypothetical protein